MSTKGSLITRVVNKFRTVNASSLPFRLKSDEVAFAVNMDFLDDFTIQQRPGSELVQDLGENVKLFSFSEMRDGLVHEHFFAIGGTKAWKYNGDSLDEIASGMKDSKNYGGVGFVNSFILSNGTDLKVFKWDDGSSAYKVSDVTDEHAPKALLWAEFHGSIWACKDGSENLFWSDAGKPESWSATSFIALGSMPVDLCAAGEFLFVGTDKGIFKISKTGIASAPFKKDTLVNVGVVPNTMQEVRAGIMGCWLTNGEYVMFNQYAKSGSEVTTNAGMQVKDAVLAADLKSDEISSFIDSKSGKAIYSMKVDFPDESVSDVFSDVENNNIQIVLNKNHLGWTFYNLQILSMEEFEGDVFYSDFSGKVYRFNAGLFQDNGNEFISRVVTAIYDEGRGDINKGYRTLWLSSNSKTKTQIDVNFSVKYDILTKFLESQMFYAYGGVFGKNRWGEFLWGGGVHKQVNSVDLDAHGPGIQFVLDKACDDADMQITSFTFSHVPSFQEG